MQSYEINTESDDILKMYRPFKTLLDDRDRWRDKAIRQEKQIERLEEELAAKDLFIETVLSHKHICKDLP